MFIDGVKHCSGLSSTALRGLAVVGAIPGPSRPVTMRARGEHHAALAPAESEQQKWKQLGALFIELMLEVSHSAPGARLSARLRDSLEKLNPSERAALVTRTRAGSAPLFMAAVRGNAEVVEYLIHVCCAELEQRGMFTDSTRTDRVTHRVTPLWAAAVAGKLHALRVLADAGADLHAASDSGSTPIRSACFMTHIEVVRFLVSRGANIHTPNHNGGTCLINSVQSPRLTALLLAAGADVHAEDTRNKTALHYAAQEHRCDSARLLLAAGADPFARSQAGDDALRAAALKGAGSVVSLLVSRVSYSVRRQADALELLGATQLDEFNDPAACLAAWRHATSLRHPPNAPHIHKTGSLWPAGEQAVGAREWSTITELEQGVGVGAGAGGGPLSVAALDWLRGQALLVCARVLTPTHKDTVFRVMYRGAAYADLLRYPRCIALWTAALASSAPAPHSARSAGLPVGRPGHDGRPTNVAQAVAAHCAHVPHCIPLTLTPPGGGVESSAIPDASAPPLSEALLAACALTRLMLDAHDGHLERARSVPAFARVHRVIVLLTECMPAFAASMSSSPLCRTHAVTQDRAMHCLTHLIYLLLETADSDQQRQIVVHHCRLLVQAGYRSALTGDTFLHLCVSRLTVLRSTYFTSDVRVRGVFPSLRTARALLAAGADATARNTQRSTPLHVAALPGNYSDQLVDTLIHAGAHMDTPNRHGDTPGVLAALAGRGHGDPALSLQCLAARALVLDRHDAIDHLPRHLHAFIDLHRP